MNLKAGLWQQQTIKLAMTQELTQAITLLQYSTQELSEFLEDKAIENPLLQIESGNVETMDPRYDHVKKAKQSSQSDKQNWLEQISKKEISIVEHLFSQMDFFAFDHKTKRVITFLINSLDDNGYLQISTDEVAQLLHATNQEVEKAIQIIQGLDPVGIGAHNLQECLLLQINREDNKNELANIIVSEYFLLFAEKKWKPIAKQLGIEMKEIQDAFDYVKTLNPRPASDFYSNQSAYITPDVIVQWDGESFSVSVFDEALPKIKFNQNYFRQFKAIGDKQVNRFLHDKQQDYHWIVKSIQQRKETISKVAIKIVEKQPDFFINGPEYLKPMTMKEISEELGIHESTVSRAVREKYVQTPFGTFELKVFFSSTIKTTSNEDASSKQVKTMLAELINKEDKFKPLSDQDLVALLKENNGIMVSRRTIAKYRDQLGIPASSKRKRFA